MCLKVRGKFKVSKKDIVCYKVLERWTDDNNSLHSAYRSDYKWELNKLMSPVENFMINREEFKKMVLHDKEVTCGMLHTFKNKRRAIKLANELSSRCYYPFQVHRCIIPKGTEYIKGRFDTNDFIQPVNYASFNLILKEEI